MYHRMAQIIFAHKVQQMFAYFRRVVIIVNGYRKVNFEHLWKAHNIQGFHNLHSFDHMALYPRLPLATRSKTAVFYGY